MTSNPEEPKAARFATVKDVGEFIFAAMLALYGVFGYYLIRDQWQVMRQQTSVMQQQTRVMQAQLADARRATIESDKVTARQLNIAESQASSLKSQADSVRSQVDSLRSQTASLRSQADSLRNEAESMRILADANKVIADAAKSSAETNARIAQSSERTAESQQRATKLEYGAWVWFSGVEVLQKDDKSGNLITASFPVPGRATYLRFTLVNTGRTPAADTTLEDIEILVGKKPVFTISREFQLIAAGAKATETISIGDSLKTVDDILGKPPDFHDGIHVTTTLSYKDVYGEKHRTQGCYESTIAVALGNPHLAIVFTSCAGNNAVVDN